MRFLLLFLLPLTFNLIAQPQLEQPLISYELVETYSQETLTTKWKEAKIPQALAPINYAINVYEVLYTMPWHDGTPVQASGLYYVPVLESGDEDDAVTVTQEAHPMLCYHHGTQIRKARRVRLGGEQAICIGFAADGYLVARPLFGLGQGR